MDKYIYFLISVFFSLPLLIIYVQKRQLRKRLIRSGLLLAPFGFINLWFRLDYWNPPEILPFYYLISIEDYLFTFVCSALSITIFDALFTKQNKVCKKPRVYMLKIFPIIIVSMFIILSSLMGILSMYVFYISIGLVNVYILIKRKDLILTSFISATLLGLIAIINYYILFNYISSNYWNKYWLLVNTKHDITILGNIPLLEVLWYASWGAFASVLFDYARGTKKIYNSLGNKLFRKFS